jgi:hypothetical protein
MPTDLNTKPSSFLDGFARHITEAMKDETLYLGQAPFTRWPEVTFTGTRPSVAMVRD